MQFTEWEHRVFGLYQLCSAGEAWTDPDTKQKRVRFFIDPVAYGELRQGNHPAFASPFFEPWEILQQMKELAGFMSSDPYAQQAATQRR